MDIRDKVVLITGASEGIGAACATAFRNRGARLILTARTREKLQQVAQQDEPVIPADLYSAEDRRRLVETATAYRGRIDILVNNAGVGLYGTTWDTSDQDARRLMELNFFAPLDLIRRTVPAMRQRESGLIVNVSSIAGKVALPWFTLYSVSKYAMSSLTEGLRMELANSGVRVMLVCPGYVSTGFQANVLGRGRPPKRLAESSAFRITAQECAEAIARGVERDRRTVVTPRSGWLLIAASRLFPRLVNAQLIRFQSEEGQQ